MNPKFCQYCGAELNEGCSCLREIAEYNEERLEEYENSPETQRGWAQQDLIDRRRYEQ